MSEAGDAVSEGTLPPLPDAFDVIDLLGLCGLVRRSPTLDGSVPLRVAQGCLPFLEGNAFGLQVVLHKRVEVRRTRLGLRARLAEHAHLLEPLLRAALPMLQREGALPRQSGWSARLAQGLVVARTFPGGQASVSLFTGLLVRPRPGVRLRVSGTRNRRSLAYDVREAVITGTAGYTPLFLEVDPREPEVTLQGEVATLAPLPASVLLRRLPLEQAPEVAQAHLSFYDRGYFETKQAGAVSRKYRHARVRGPAPAAAPAVTLDLIEAGPHGVTEGGPRVVHGPAGASAASGVDRLLVRSAVALSVRFDGLRVDVTPDRAGLATFAEAVRARWAPWFSPRAAAPLHPGALLYLTKYVTPHPAGEPHFFVKPCALFRTGPGVSLLVEGLGGEGYEVLRGVVESDWFHAAPAVFALTRPGALEVPAGTPLAELHPVPRALLGAPFSLRRAGPLAELA